MTMIESISPQSQVLHVILIDSQRQQYPWYSITTIHQGLWSIENIVQPEGNLVLIFAVKDPFPDITQHSIKMPTSIFTRKLDLLYLVYFIIHIPVMFRMFYLFIVFWVFFTFFLFFFFLLLFFFLFSFSSSTPSSSPSPFLLLPSSSPPCHQSSTPHTQTQLLPPLNPLLTLPSSNGPPNPLPTLPYTHLPDLNQKLLHNNLQWSILHISTQLLHTIHLVRAISSCTR